MLTSKIAHTPGPWTVNGQRIEADSHEAFGTLGRYGVPIATILDDPPTRHQVQGNLRLMSAAPELYEALEMVRDADNDCRADGLPTIPAIARAQIDAVLGKVDRWTSELPRLLEQLHTSLRGTLNPSDLDLQRLADDGGPALEL